MAWVYLKYSKDPKLLEAEALAKRRWHRGNGGFKRRLRDTGVKSRKGEPSHIFSDCDRHRNSEGSSFSALPPTLFRIPCVFKIGSLLSKEHSSNDGSPFAGASELADVSNPASKYIA